MTLAIKGKYVDFITNYIAQSPYGTPIFTAEVTERVMEEFGLEETQARKIVNTNLNRLNGVVLESFRKGIYYKPKTTAFGKSHLNPDQVVKKCTYPLKKMLESVMKQEHRSNTDWGLQLKCPNIILLQLT